MKKLRLWIRNYFGFSQNETDGFILLSLLITTLLLLPIFTNFFLKTESVPSAKESQYFEQWLNKFANDTSSYSSSKPLATQTGKQRRSKPSSITLSPFPFDPNQASRAELLRLGLPSKIVNNLLKYRDKGGKFRKKEDFAKLYGLSQKQYQILAPYIQINASKHAKEQLPKRAKASKPANQPFKKQEIRPIDLNQADTSDLRQIRGIGAVLSQRIISFREKLGGFIRVEQVREVYHLDPEVAEALLAHAYLSDTKIRQIAINQASFEELSQHPYINYNLARAIINYREQHGDYASLEDLSRIQIIKSETLEKIAPYLSWK